MKPISILQTLTVLGVSAAIFSTSASSQEEGGKGKGNPGQMFERADANKDGKLSESEVPAQAWERLSKSDADGDGAVTKEEIAAAMKDRPEGGKGQPGGEKGMKGEKGGKGGKGDPGAMFARADKNEDGKLSSDEVPAEHWERLSKADADEDGLVSKEELAAAFKNRPGGRPEGEKGEKGMKGGKGAKGGMAFDRFDENKDEKLTESEVPAEVWEKMSRADADKDGAVTKEELGNAMRQMGDRGGKGGKGGPEGGAGALFGKFDENKDEKLSESEVPGEVWAKLRNADTDADGLISKEEIGKIYDRNGGGNADAPKPEAAKKRPEFE